MKKILLATLVLVSGLFYSCDKDFLETRPTDAYDESTVLSTTDNLLSVINGMHKNLYRQYNSTQSESGMGGMYILNEFLGEDLVSAYSNGWFMAQHRWQDHRNKNGAWAKHVYEFYYMLIANANKVLDYADDATGSDADRNVAKGQALAYRAFSYLNLIQYYAPRYDASTASTQSGVPLLITYTAEPQPRATVADVYQQIDTDLTNAYTLLQNYDRGSDKSQIYAITVQGLQARAALARGIYEDARDYAKAARVAFEAAGGRLMTGSELADRTAKTTNGFNDITNVEWIWGSKIISDQTLYFYAYHMYMAYNAGSTNVRTGPKRINSLLYANIASTDARSYLWEPNPTTANFPLPTTAYTRGDHMNRKFTISSPGTTVVADLLHMRLAEMYLIEAEARAHLGDATAATVLNQLIVTRDPGYDATTYAAAAGRTMLDEVLIQRRIELWGEGFRFLDLKRLNLPLDRTGANFDITVAEKMNEPAGTNEWTFHFPQSEENANPFIKDNPNP